MTTKKKMFLMLFFAMIFQISVGQQKTITGTVKDETGLLPGVTVTNKSDKKSVATDFDGKYSIKANEGDLVTFSFMGYATKSVTVGQTQTINVQLTSDSKIIEEVVVVGYGTQKRKEVTSSISKINGNDLRGLVTPSFEGQLAGRAAGVQVTTQNGILGEAPRIRIRGIGSISGVNSPLIIVDGMPIYSGDTGGQAAANGLGDINPNDIESYDVLKDGAATAVYGSRAANGVILITTKKGKRGSVTIDYNSVVGFSSAVQTFDLLKTNDFLVIANEKRTNRPTPLTPWAAGANFDTDWQGAVLRKDAVQIDHNLSLSGGSEQTRYALSFGYTTQEGIAKANDMKRYTLRTNIEHDINKWLKIGGSVGLTRTEYNGLNTGRASLSGNIFNAIRQLPNTPIYDASNPTGYNLSPTQDFVGQGTNLQPVGDNISNIVFSLENNKFVSKVNRTLINTFVSADIAKGLNFRIQASYDNANTGGFLYWSPVHGDGRSTNGRLQNDNSESLRWNWQNVLTYNTTIAKKHNISATAVSEYQKERNQFIQGVGTNLLDAFYNQNLVTGAYGTQESSGGITEAGLISYLGRVSYNYDQKYFVQASLRNDGLSRFERNSRYNNFIGYSAGWNIAKENFMQAIRSTVSELKLRASFAQTGNDLVLGGAFYPYQNLTSASQYGSLNGIGFTQLGNNLLTWETSKKTDFGVDLGLFNDKIRLTFDYFNNDQDGLVLYVPTAPSLGIPDNRVPKNIGSMYTRGYEFGLDFNPIKTKNLSWNINTNLTLQQNKVTSVPSDILGGSFTDTNIAPNLIIREGESINSIYGFEYWGVNAANGNPVYYKADGSLVQGNIPTQSYFVFNPADPTNLSIPATLSAVADRKILGNTLPTYFGAITNRINYKNFDLTFLVRFSGGNKIFNSTRRDLVNQNLNNNGTEILGRWQSPSQPGDGVTPRLWSGANAFVNLTGNASTRFVEDGDFISLDNLSFGYSLPKPFINKIGLKNVRLFVQGQNLLFITKYKGINPEMETAGVDLNGTPRAKTYSAGINVNL
jgi:TonB-linked SusC/RagA family outer membrane protein